MREELNKKNNDGKTEFLTREEFNKELKKQVDGVRKMFDSYYDSKNNTKKQ